MPAPSLMDVAKRKAIRNIEKLDDMGDLPYRILRPILLKVENPYQLAEIEKNSPQIAGEDSELWKAFIRRDIPNWRTMQREPSNPNNWFSLYKRLERQNKREVDAATEELRRQFGAMQKEKEESAVKMIYRPLSGKSGVRPPRTVSQRPEDRGILQFGTKGSRTKTLTGAGIIQKIRRTTADAKQQRGASLSIPAAILTSRRSKQVQAPKGMLLDYTKPHMPGEHNPGGSAKTSTTTGGSSSTRPSTSVTASQPTDPEVLSKQERRLRALANSGFQRPTPQASSPVSKQTQVTSTPTPAPEKRFTPSSQDYIYRPTVSATPITKRKREVNVLMPAPKRRR